MERENIFAKLKIVQNQDIPDYNAPLERDLKNLSVTEIPVSPNNPPWNSGVAFVFWIVSVIFIAVIPSLLIIPYILQQNIKFSEAERLKEMATTDPTAIVIAIAGTMLAHILTLILGWMIVTRMNKYPFFETLGWKWGGFRVWHAIALFFGVFMLAGTLSYFLGAPDNEMQKIIRSSRTAALAVAFLATLTAPLVEEVIYRGVLYSAFQRTFNKTNAVIFVTVIFASVHFLQYYPNYSVLISITLLSLIITLIRAKTDNLLPCFAFHTLINGIQSIAIVFAPYLPESLDPTQPVNGFFWMN